MSTEWLTQIQDELQPIVVKPNMTEKLLSRPPFRFLHDIITNFVKNTNFPRGYYSEDEMDSSKITTKEEKMHFLAKTISILELGTGTLCMAQPAKIVAGQEPEATGEMLMKLVAFDKLSDEEKAKAFSADPKSRATMAPAASHCATAGGGDAAGSGLRKVASPSSLTYSTPSPPHTPRHDAGSSKKEKKVPAKYCWSPNGNRLAVIESTGLLPVVILIDPNTQEVRDKFRLKAGNPTNHGTVRVNAISYSPCSTKLAVAVSDHMIYVYKLGREWGDRKVICNKWPQDTTEANTAVSCMCWATPFAFSSSADQFIVYGNRVGTIKNCILKTNKSVTVCGGSVAPCVAIAALDNLTIVCGHEDGVVILLRQDNLGYSRTLITTESPSRSPSLPVAAVAVSPGHEVNIAMCDSSGRLSVWNHRREKTFDGLINGEEGEEELRGLAAKEEIDDSKNEESSSSSSSSPSFPFELSFHCQDGRDPLLVATSHNSVRILSTPSASNSAAAAEPVLIRSNKCSVFSRAHLYWGREHEVLEEEEEEGGAEKKDDEHAERTLEEGEVPILKKTTVLRDVEAPCVRIIFDVSADFSEDVHLLLAQQMLTAGVKATQLLASESIPSVLMPPDLVAHTCDFMGLHEL